MQAVPPARAGLPVPSHRRMAGLLGPWVLLVALLGCDAESAAPPDRPEPGRIEFGRDLDSVFLELSDPLTTSRAGEDVSYLAELRDEPGDAVIVTVRLDDELIVTTTRMVPEDAIHELGGTIEGAEIAGGGRLTVSIAGEGGGVLAEGGIDIVSGPSQSPEG